MSDLFWLTDDQMERLRPFFPKSHGKPRVDDRRVLSGIVFVNRNGLRWRDAPSAYGPHKTLYNRWKRWGERGVFTRMMEGLAEGLAWPARHGRAPALTRIGEILAALNAQGKAPDIILVQEMFSPAAVRGLTNAGYPYRAWGPTRTQRRRSPSRNRVKGPQRWGKGETGFHLVGSGLAIFSRYPIIATSSEPFGTRRCAGFDCLSNKGAQHARIRVPGVPTPVDLFNTHLNSQAEARVPVARHGAAQALQFVDIADFLAIHATDRVPAIFGGDFNMAGTPDRLARLEQTLGRYTMVHRFCAAAGSPCHVGLSWDGDAPWADTEDLQLYRSGTSLTVTPIRIEAMFDGAAGQPQLSDHDGLRVTYRLDWPASP